MIARTNAVFSIAPRALEVVAWSAASSSLFAATMGPGENEIKRVLAYSTVVAAWIHVSCVAEWALFTAGRFSPDDACFLQSAPLLGSGSVIHITIGRAGYAQEGRAVGQRFHDRRAHFWLLRSPSAGYSAAGRFFRKDAILGSRHSSIVRSFGCLGLLRRG